MELGVGVIGTGLMGLMHARIYATLPNCRLVAVADNDEGCLKTATEALGVKGYKDFVEMLDKESDIRAISICTPDKLHLEPAEAAAKRGVSLLIEKPIARTIEKSRQIIELAESNGVTLLIGHLLRFDASYAQAFQAIRAGDIGKIVHVYARRNDLITDAKRLGGRTTLPFYLGVHDYDIMNWFIQNKAETVYGVSNSLVLKELNVNDSVFATFKFQDGTIASWEGSWIMPESIGKSDMGMEVVGTKGVIYIDAYNSGLRIHTETFKMPGTMYNAEGNDRRVIGALREQLVHFVDCVVNDKEALVSGADALEAVRMATAVEDSLVKGRPVSVRDQT